MATSKKNEVIEIPAMNLKMLTLSIKGTSPLIVHAWSHKAKQMMLDKQMVDNALAELESVRRKYKNVTELDAIFSEIERLRKESA